MAASNGKICYKEREKRLFAYSKTTQGCVGTFPDGIITGIIVGLLEDPRPHGLSPGCRVSLTTPFEQRAPKADRHTQETKRGVSSDRRQIVCFFPCVDEEVFERY